MWHATPIKGQAGRQAAGEAAGEARSVRLSHPGQEAGGGMACRSSIQSPCSFLPSPSHLAEEKETSQHIQVMLQEHAHIYLSIQPQWKAKAGRHDHHHHKAQPGIHAFIFFLPLLPAFIIDTC